MVDHRLAGELYYYKYKIHRILEAIDCNIQQVRYFTFDHSLPKIFLNDFILAGNEDDVAL